MKTEIVKTILELIAYEPTISDKLSMLTEIGLTSRNKDVFDATEEVRHDLSEVKEIENRILNKLLRETDPVLSYVKVTSDGDTEADGTGLFV